MNRETSAEVYRQIKAEGLLSRLRFAVYDWLYHHGPATQMEVCRGLASHHQDRSIMPRFAEMERMGVIYSPGERECKVTRRKVMLWDVTSNLPIKLNGKAKPLVIMACLEHLEFIPWGETQCVQARASLFRCRIRKLKEC